MRTNWQSWQNAVHGVLSFPATTDLVTSTVRPALAIVLYMHDSPIPTRQHKLAEVSTTGISSLYNSGFQARFYGTQDPLTVTLTGWLITPVSNGLWAPTGMSLPNHSYADIIAAYVEGRMARYATGKWQRIDPSSYTDVYGHVYNNPKIMTYEFGYTAVTKRQTFTMQLWLENSSNG